MLPITECQDDLVTITYERDECQSDLNTCSGALDTCEDNLATCTSEMDACEEDLNNCSSNLDTCQDDLATRTAERDECEEEKANLQAALDQGNTGLEEIKELLEQLPGQRESDTYYTGTLGELLNEIIDILVSPPGKASSDNG